MIRQTKSATRAFLACAPVAILATLPAIASADVVSDAVTEIGVLKTAVGTIGLAVIGVVGVIALVNLVRSMMKKH